jgi:hypothetical protein
VFVQIYNYLEAIDSWRHVPWSSFSLYILLTPLIVDIENYVEFKSLPSGLHNVKEDLVYVCRAV